MEAPMRTSKKLLPLRPLRQEMHWVPESREVLLPGRTKATRPFRVWTLYMERDPAKTPTLPFTPVHRSGAFLEDFLHDWNMRGETLRYYSRAMDSKVWILVEYKDEGKTS